MKEIEGKITQSGGGGGAHLIPEKRLNIACNCEVGIIENIKMGDEHVQATTLDEKGEKKTKFQMRKIR